MKKQLLILSFLIGINAFAFGQDYTQAADNSGFTYNCDLSNGTEYAWTYYIADCSWSDNGAGGADATATNEVSYNWGHGSAGNVYIFFVPTTPLNLSANPKVSFTLRSEDGSGAALPLNYTVFLKDAGTPDVDISNEMPLNLTGTNQAFTIDFTGQELAGKNFTSVGSIVFHYTDCPTLATSSAHLVISNFKAGSYVTVAGVDVAKNSDNLNVFPNPASDMISIEGVNSLSDATVKVLDNTGKVLLVKETAFPATLSISELAKGSYILSIETAEGIITKKLLKY